jgi:hypothetical protein
MPFHPKGHLVLMFLLFSAACGQSVMRSPQDAPRSDQAAKGKVVGIVKDLGEDPIAGASILLKCSSSNMQYEATTNWYGKYVFRKVPPGLYSISIKAYDYQKKSLDKVAVSAATTLRLTSVLIEDPEKLIVFRDPAQMINHRTATSGIRVWQDHKGIVHVENE